ncbi:MAG: hypothetical protein UT29_C0002G0008 [Candidatus Yanofskybacteria bacterium GW2011_GWA1_39_13]|uniref:DUF2061 domain-containing protein n=1 Tax=Yanofskybacteria sp. (strain GW2011_GWA1_39_13) TaxID=1619019 RepID=A0A0G0MPS9_YANXG|nr:MAG: hypothetical protein UT29_C0002G0008 [Candidatus Yanofskybacteria bacterium GW2011_GWA1_39_13]
MNIHPIDGLINNSQARSISKAITWRIIAATITGTIVFVYTGKLKETGEILMVAEIILTIAYYLHERFWILIRKKKS